MIVGLKAKDILLYLLFVYGKFGVLMEKIMIFSSFTIPLNIPLAVVSFFFSFFFKEGTQNRGDKLMRGYSINDEPQGSPLTGGNPSGSIE